MLLTRRGFCLQSLALALPARKDDLDHLVREALRAWDVPGAAVAIVRDDRVEYLAGHGVRAAGDEAAITSRTLFPLGSCTKGFTSAALALLVDEGKLGWDDPVRKHVASFRLSDPLADRRVVLRDLLCHRTGLGTHDLLWYRAAWTPAESVRRAGHLPLERPFRSSFRYQTTMFTAAGLAVESASGQSWTEFVKRRFFEPLEMKSAGVSTASYRSSDRASGHRLTARGEPEVLPGWCPCPNPDPAYTIHASAADLCGWLRYQLTTKALAETHKPQMVIPFERERAYHPETTQMSYGLGWVIQDYHGHKVVAHAGVLEGFRVQLTLVPRAKLGLAILANLHATRMNLALNYTLLDALLGLDKRDWHEHMQAEVRKDNEAAEKTRRAERARRADTTPSRGLDAYAADYDHPAYGQAKVTLERGRLSFRWGAFTAPLSHFHHDTFSLEQEHLGFALLSFALNSRGDVFEMIAGEPFGVTFQRKA